MSHLLGAGDLLLLERVLGAQHEQLAVARGLQSHGLPMLLRLLLLLDVVQRAHGPVEVAAELLLLLLLLALPFLLSPAVLTSFFRARSLARSLAPSLTHFVKLV